MGKNPSIKEAWLNRTGTVYAIVWADADKTNEVAKPIFTKYQVGFTAAKNNDAKNMQKHSAKKSWYRGADVDKLSIEEAGVIANDAVTFAFK